MAISTCVALTAPAAASVLPGIHTFVEGRALLPSQVAAVHIGAHVEQEGVGADLPPAGKEVQQ
ncbi:hypothetical protein [Tateyamaria sp. syn59]|uniref:hypothetical protein n=1 Tax=Tateyamaria sp. syn59 TaxID=2576942 RepID=UPI0011BE3E07|nr:hypothetical protein [Tateyamaria sp. syn59]